MYAKIAAPTFDGTQPCKGMNTEEFFPVDRIEEERFKRVIKPVCDSCKFRSECLQWALDNREIGIWAGTTTDERRLIIRRLRRK
jgi:WhiB family redox-sensing transcriptional regulator